MKTKKLRSIPPMNRNRKRLHLTRAIAKTGEVLPEVIGGLLGAMLQPVGEILTKIVETDDDKDSD